MLVSPEGSIQTPLTFLLGQVGSWLSRPLWNAGHRGTKEVEEVGGLLCLSHCGGCSAVLGDLAAGQGVLAPSCGCFWPSPNSGVTSGGAPLPSAVTASPGDASCATPRASCLPVVPPRRPPCASPSISYLMVCRDLGSRAPTGGGRQILRALVRAAGGDPGARRVGGSYLPNGLPQLRGGCYLLWIWGLAPSFCGLFPAL